LTTLKTNQATSPIVLRKGEVPYPDADPILITGCDMWTVATIHPDTDPARAAQEIIRRIPHVPACLGDRLSALLNDPSSGPIRIA
jgi:hypothetical protein